MRFYTGIIILVLLSFLSSSATAQEKKPPRDIKFSSDTADYDENLNRVRLVGDVVITSEGSRLEAPYAVYYTVKQYAEFLGGVKMVGGHHLCRRGAAGVEDPRERLCSQT